MSLRKELKDLINKADISVARLARITDIHQDTIYKFLEGETEMTAANLDKLFKELRDGKHLPAGRN